MSLKRALFFALAGFWSVFLPLIAAVGHSRFIDAEGALWLFVLSAAVLFFTAEGSKATLPLFLIIAYYIVTKYLLGGLKLVLSEVYADRSWVIESYSWAGRRQVDAWLEHGAWCTWSLCAGTWLVDRLSGGASEELTKRDRDPVSLPLPALFAVLAFFLVHSAALFWRVGYGAISGINSDAMATLYGLITVEPVLLMPLALLISGQAMRRHERTMSIALILGLCAFRILSGSRSFLLYPIVFFFFFAAYFKGNFKLPRKWLLAFAFLGAMNILLYPAALVFKDMIRKSPNPGRAIRDTIASGFVVDRTKVFFRAEGGARLLEALDRLSDMGAPLRIINDAAVNPPGPHMTIASVLKRTVNEMVPGDVFHDVMRMQEIYHYLYFDQKVAYGGENWGFSGVYYLMFGYAGSLAALFLTGAAGTWLWLQLGLMATGWRPILIAYTLNAAYAFLDNTLLEGWFTVCVYRPVLTLTIVLGASFALQAAASAMRALVSGRAAARTG